MTNRPRKSAAQWREEVLGALRASRSWMSCYDLAVAVTGAPRGMQSGRQTQQVRVICEQLAAEGLADARKDGKRAAYRARLPRIVCLCGAVRFDGLIKEQRIARTVAGEIVVSAGTGPPRAAGDGETVMRLDELQLRMIDLADYILVVSDESGYFGEPVAREIAYAARQGKPVEFTAAIAGARAVTQGLLS